MSPSVKKNQRNFRCSRKDAGCQSVIYISIDSNGYKGSNYAEHNHPPNYHHTKRLLVLQNVKDTVLLEPTPVTRIIEDEYIKNNLNNEDRCHFLLPQAQASRYYKIRAKLLPPNPKSLDFEVPALYSTTHEGENFLLYDSTHKKLGGRLMILSSKYLIQMLCSCDVMLIDGTFKIRPSMFSQVDVIMGQHLDEAIPLVWCLTPKRLQEVYEKIFQVLKRKSLDYGFNFEPKCAYLDFEIGTINTLEKIFSSISIHGRWHHYTQSIYRNIQKIGLSTLYEQSEEVKIWLKCFMALPLVKNTVVGAAIDYLIDNPPLSHILLIEFNEYFRKQWIDRIPIKYWNLGPIHLRCNNSVEGYNNRLQPRFGGHPQLWSFIHFLKGKEALVMMRTAQIQSGNYRLKAMPFSFGNERARKKTKQLKN
ncbi:unnamed protein product [Rotaria sp. Silwood2]|nr:unnamed protein product [Rotaria sp. Silwood2]